jgi:tripartite-type tricarboxylate transporter receptor subunit TctC
MPVMSRRVFVAGVLASPATAWAQEWPTRQITLIAPFPAGGSVDVIARLVQSGLQQALGSTVIIENKAGAQGSIGTAAAAKAAPDGGTWVIVFDTHAVNPALQNLPFDTEKDFAPVLLIGTAPHILACHRRAPSNPSPTSSRPPRRNPERSRSLRSASAALDT